RRPGDRVNGDGGCQNGEMESESHGRVLSIAVLLPQPATEPEHQLNAFDLVEPVLERRGQLSRFGDDQPGRTRRPELASGDGAVTVERAVADDRTQLV